MGDAAILRLVERSGKPQTATVDWKLTEHQVRLNFTPFEIKTIRIPVNQEEPVREVNLLEE